MNQPEQIKLLAEKLDIPEDEVQMMTQRMSGRDLSLDVKPSEDSANTLLDYQKGNDVSLEDDLGRRQEIAQS